MAKNTKYIGFWQRVVASVIDSVIFFIIFRTISLGFEYSSMSLMKTLFISLGLYVLLEAVYEIFLTSIYGGTVGKILIKAKVVDEKGKNISFARSTGRYFAKIISTITLMIGYLMVAWDPEKQGIHDKIANTYVINDENSKISKRAKKIILIIFAAIAILYVLFVITAMSLSIGYGIKSGLQNLDGPDVIGDIKNICNSSITYKSDLCYNAFKDNKAVLGLDVTKHLEFCDLIKGKEGNSNCVFSVALEENDKSYCNRTNSKRSKLSCEKAYDWFSSLTNIFNQTSKYEKEVEAYNLTLNGNLRLGYQYNGECVDLLTPVYLYSDKPCIHLINVGPFALDPEIKLHWPGDVIKIYNQDGRIVRSKSNIFDKDLQIFINGNVMDDWSNKFDVNMLPPGVYRIEESFYDLVGKKGIKLNQTFSVKENYTFGKLKNDGLVLGVTTDDMYCEEVVSMQNGDRVCMWPTVSGFEKGSDGTSWFDMDLKVYDENGVLYDISKDIYGDKGKKVMPSGKLFDSFAIISTDQYPEGYYNFELTVRDILSRKTITYNETFYLNSRG